jgi:hypothetical protein
VVTNAPVKTQARRLRTKDFSDNGQQIIQEYKNYLTQSHINKIFEQVCAWIEKGVRCAKHRKSYLERPT